MDRTACLVCGGARLEEVIDLGLHPFADRFIPEAQLGTPDAVYPLVLDQCLACGQVQSRTITDPQERYNGAVAYAYTSANSETSRTHWDQFASCVIDRVGLHAGDQVLEIGSNDGYLCTAFQHRGLRAFGVEASRAMGDLATARGVLTITGLWDATLGRSLREWLSPPLFKLVVANNVVNHANDPIDFLHGVAAVLADDGYFVCEVPAWERLVASGGFDQIYHEHVTYWSFSSLLRACNTAGLAVVSGELVDYHGGSWRIYAKRGDHGMQNVQLPSDYTPFRQRVEQQRLHFLRAFLGRDGSRPVVCVGAAAKANTFLTYCGLTFPIVTCVTDRSPQKIGTYTPGTRIPIRSDTVLAGMDRPYAIVTAWNLAEVLTPALLAINPTIEFLSPREAV
jgi:SAM-dependent methyltransferase